MDELGLVLNFLECFLDIATAVVDFNATKSAASTAPVASPVAAEDSHEVMDPAPTSPEVERFRISQLATNDFLPLLRNEKLHVPDIGDVRVRFGRHT